MNREIIKQNSISILTKLTDYTLQTQKPIQIQKPPQSQMKRKHAGLILILMMLGHNYVINQPQSLQHQIQRIHSVTVTQFNLLYSIPSILAILTIIPVGILYHKYPNFTLMFGITVMFAGQLLASMFGSQGKEHYFAIFVGGRTLEASGAEILYMIQGNLASSWMGNFAGLVFILPEVGEIMNAFFTPYAAINWGVKTALFIGVIFCFISAIACWYLYCELKNRRKIKSSTHIEMSDQISRQTTSQTEIHSQTTQQNDHKQHLPSSQSSRETVTNHHKVKSGQRQKNSEHQGNQRTSDEQLHENRPNMPEPQSIFKVGKVFWLTILICAINECLYFPFLDNANQLIQTRFKIPYKETGIFLCLPFCAAILTTMIMSKILVCVERKNLIFYSSALPFLGHLMIVMLPNCEEESLTLSGKLLLASGFFVFGTGIGAYYSVSFPAVGMAVPQKIRGLSYGVLCFFQTLAMSLIPILSGLIIQQDVTNQIQGYRHSSMMFVGLTIGGIFVAYLIKRFGNQWSYSYDDEEGLIEEEDLGEVSNQKIEMKANEKQKKYQTVESEKSFGQNN